MEITDMEEMETVPARELLRLRRIDEGNPKLCDGANCDYQKAYNKEKYIKDRTKVGITKVLTSLEFWVYVFFNVTLYLIDFTLQATEKVLIASIIASGIAAFALTFFRPLSKLIGEGKMNVNVGATATVSKNISESNQGGGK